MEGLGMKCSDVLGKIRGILHGNILPSNKGMTSGTSCITRTLSY